LLIIVATPIGNLEDLSPRALAALRAADAILCEDTRRTLILLDRFQIKKSLLPYHKFNEQESRDAILSRLEAGQTLALVSDAGTPCINDPGQRLVAACQEKGLAVQAIPGPCSIIQALVLSGFDTSQFQFIGFLPKKPKAALKRAMGYPGTTVAFESPERLVDTLALIDPAREVAVVREMTKIHEECRKGLAGELLAHFQQKPPRGEIVLLIGQGPLPSDLTLQELVEMLQELHGLSLKEAIKEAAHLQKVPKREVYKQFLTGNREQFSSEDERINTDDGK
jgi:16S rRNA (cytidine1402-2'-O)-methyltransferase